MFVKLNKGQLVSRVLIGSNRVITHDIIRKEYPCRHCGKVIKVGDPMTWFRAIKALGPLPEEDESFSFHPDCFEKIAYRNFYPNTSGVNGAPEVTWFPAA